MLKDGRKPSGVVTHLRRVQALFSWLSSEGKLLSNPFDGVAMPKIRKSKRVSYCTRAQRDQLIETCDREDLLFVLMAGFYLGLRKNEIIEARPE